MNGNWIKVVLFVLVVIMLTGIVTALLDPGLGKPDDSRRTRHVAGFSIAYPLGWGGSAFGTGRDGDNNYVRLAPERRTGRETSISVVFSGTKAPSAPSAESRTFQDEPAFYSAGRGKRDWFWRIQFQRDQNWYQITLISPIEFDVEKSDYWPFIYSFRMEKPIMPPASQATQQDLPAVIPVE